ncbi:MAG: 30S ribosomal protein S6 [Candidatus Moraniibacteriota bacterium]|nr:MAG: 30S ribosomal protein S6 [Candidatus Moranbacteria bacterium]
MRYEILYLIGEPDTANLEVISKTVEDQLTSRGAILSEERWENRRKLAYPIKHITRGTFIARRFEMPEKEIVLGKNDTEEPISSLQKQLNLMPEILRHIIVRADELPSLKDFSSRKEEEKLKHSQEPKSSASKNVSGRKFEKKPLEKKPISSEPFIKIEKQEESTPEKTPSEKEDMPKSKPISDDTTKEIDEKLDEILNM